LPGKSVTIVTSAPAPYDASRRAYTTGGKIACQREVLNHTPYTLADAHDPSEVADMVRMDGMRAAVKVAKRAGVPDAYNYVADTVRQHAELDAIRAGNAIAPDVPYADDPAAWHAVFSEETRSLMRTILRHRRAGNRDAAKAVRCLLPSRDDWREWTGTQTVRQIRHYARAARANEALAYAAYLYAVDRPGVLASDPVARILYEAGVGM
jgi:hypothetical protein